MAYIYDLADVWASSGTTFTGIKMNVTDTASAAGSLLMDLQVGGESRFKTTKDGETTFAIKNTGGTPTISFLKSGSASSQMSITGSFGIAGNSSMSIAANGPIWLDSTYVSISSVPNNDVRLYRDAANTLAQRNGVSAQAFNLYNTYTDASNYERGFMRFASNVLEIGAQSAGTGAVRNVKIYQNFDKQVLISAGGWDFWHGNGSSTGFGLYPYEARHGSTTIGFSAGNSGTASDAGIARTAAAQLRITNGSTGTGQLIFIVPTTNPGITGALWNNAGTLAIS